MKILIVNSHISWGGLGQFTINLVQGLLDKQNEVYGIITHEDDGLFHDFKKLVKKNYYLGNHNKLVKYLKLIVLANKVNPDVIYINDNAPIHFVLPFVRCKKIISIIHSDQTEFYRICAINKKYVSKWVAPTKQVKINFEKYLQTPYLNNLIKIIPHGVKPSEFNVSTVESKDFEIVFIGAIYEHKGVQLLPEILNSITKKIKDVHLTIIGEGDLLIELKEKFNLMNLSKHVTFTGVLSNLKTREILNNSDVLLFPTRLESFGLVIIEAMMEGTVPIVTNLTNITDQIIDDDQNGVLINYNDIDGFSKKIIQLYFNPNKLSNLKIKAKSKALKFFSVDAMVTEYIRLVN